jgi:hypothetical protein
LNLELLEDVSTGQRLHSEEAHEGIKMEKNVISCTLGVGELKDRTEWIADLNSRSLKGCQMDGLTLTLDYDCDALSDIRELVAREQQCCAFLTFGIVQHADFVRLSIEVPPNCGHDGATVLLEPFAPRANPKSPPMCGCREERGL